MNEIKYSNPRPDPTHLKATTRRERERERRGTMRGRMLEEKLRNDRKGKETSGNERKMSNM